MKRLAVLGLVIACGHPGGHGGGGDAGPSSEAGDGASADASSTGGADAAIDGALPVDPATCVVGQADGCCPTHVGYGGHDPDCPSLGCASVQISDPIPLDADWRTYGISGVGMAWTGRELVLAWPDVRASSPTGIPTIEYQRRDETGTLTYGPVHHDDRATAPGVDHATPELGFEPTTHTIMYASSKLYRRYAETLDALGAPASPATMIGVDCHPIMSRFQIYASQGSFLVAQGNDPCSGQEWHGARVDTFSATGVHADTSYGDQGIHQVGMTYDAAADRIVFSGGNQYLSARVFTPPGTWSGARMLANASTYNTAISASGDAFLVAYGSYYLSGNRITSDPITGTWTIDSAANPAVARPPAELTFGAHRQSVAPRMVWTGDGWFKLMSAFPWEHQGLPDSWASFSTLVWSFAPDGSLRQTFALDSTQPTYLVNAIWAGGKVAVTYVAMNAQGQERRYLRYFSCAPAT